jgi:hypothetical protein
MISSMFGQLQDDVGGGGIGRLKSSNSILLNLKHLGYIST